MSNVKAIPSTQTKRRSFLKGAMAATTMTSLSSQRVLGANERLGVGVIGTGGRGGSHLRAVDTLKTESNVQLVAGCDTYRPRLMKAKERYSLAKVYMDHNELLNDPNVDVVSIATPDHIHGYQAIDAVKAGKDVYCEKPVTHWRQFELVKQLAKEVKKSGRAFQLGTQGMSDGAWHLMKQLVQDGLIGQPIHAECGYFRIGDWGERGMPIDDPNAKPGPDLDWDGFLGDSPKHQFSTSRYFRWRMYDDYAGGPVTDLYPHSLTPVISILGVGLPDDVVASGGKFRYQEREIPDTFNLIINYPEDISVVLMGTQGNDYSGTGSRGAGGRIPLIRGWDGTLTVQGNEIAFSPTSSGKDEEGKEAKRFPIAYGEDFHRYWKSFFDDCRAGNQDTLSSATLAYHVQTALQMGMWGFLESKTARFNTLSEEIVL